MRGTGTESHQRAKESRTIPSLDGLRAVSIALVLLAHAQNTRGFPRMPAFLVDHGFLGVQIFFVISGFLITRLLLEERAATGRISLGLFYARRTLRIFPPFYIYLAVIAAGTWIGIFSVPRKDFLFAATYTMNYLTSGGVWLTGHIWSLSVEEQFYLVWPLTMKLAGPRRACWIAGALAFGGPPVCLAAYLINHHLGSSLASWFPFIADSIASGCILAAGLPWIRRHARVLRLSHPLGALVFPAVLLLDLGRNHPRVHLALTETALNLCICYTIARYTEFPRGVVGRILNNPVLAFIGKLSYSLYLWQQIFVNRYGTSFVQAFPINIGAAFACALLSYYSVELPMAGMRRRLRAKPLRGSAAVELQTPSRSGIRSVGTT